MKSLTKRQSEILQFIKEFLAEKHYSPSIREIASYYSITPKGAYDHVKALEKKGYIALSHNKSRSISLISKDDSKGDALRVPIIGRVAAGLPLFAEENREGYVTIPSDIARKGNLFALTVQGESMTGAGILDGDLAVFLQQPVAENGEIVVAMVDEAVTLKRFYKESHRIRLQSENPDYPSLFTQDAKILGKLVTVIRQYG